MSTHSYIAVQNSPTDFDVIYLHWDGYIDHAGVMLLNNYSTLKQARELVALGDLTGIDYTITGCEAFHRDRLEDWEDVKPSKMASFEELAEHADGDYLYVWIPYEASEPSGGQRGPGMWSAFKRGGSIKIEKGIEDND